VQEKTITVDQTITKTNGWIMNSESTTEKVTVVTKDTVSGKERTDETKPVKIKTVTQPNEGLKRAGVAGIASGVGIVAECMEQNRLPTAKDAGKLGIPIAKNYVQGMVINAVEACAGLSKSKAAKAGCIGGVAVIIARLLEIRNSERQITWEELTAELLPELALHGIQVMAVYMESALMKGGLAYASIAIDGVLAARLYYHGDISGKDFIVNVATKTVVTIVSAGVISGAGSVAVSLGAGAILGGIIVPGLVAGGVALGTRYVSEKIRQNDQLQAEVAAQNVYTAQLQAQVAAQNVQNAQLQAQIAALQAQLARGGN
jgi:hypothetical protein